MIVQTRERSAGTSAATDTEPDLRVVELRRRVEVLATRCADAEAEFDAAVTAGFPMHLLVLRDQEVAAASKAHRDAVRALRRVTPSRRPSPPLVVTERCC